MVRKVTDSSLQVAAALVLAVMVLAVALPVGGAQAATACNAGQLAVCAAAITGGAKPTPACCSSLRAQQGCFCQYARNPAYGRYITDPNARRTVASCGIALPKC